MSKSKQKEKEPESNKPKKSAYLVCHGAICTCDAGAKPAKLKVTANKKIYINDDSSHLLATEKDFIFDPPSLPFASCKNKPGQDKSCTPQFQKWEKTYESITAEGNKVLVDKSELMCMAFGGKVTVLKHGQVQQVSPCQMENLTTTMATQLNALAAPKKLNNKEANVSVSGIKGEVVESEEFKPVIPQKRETINSLTYDQLKKDPKRAERLPKLLLRPGEEARFTATFKNDESLISWCVDHFKGKEPFYYLQYGKHFTTCFPNEGTYHIEAYGTFGDGILDTDTKLNVKTGATEGRIPDPACMLEIEVRRNELKKIRLIGDGSQLIMGVGNDPDSVRANYPVTIGTDFLLPAIQEDLDGLSIVVRDGEGNELERSTGQPTMTFTPLNTGASFRAEATLLSAETAQTKTLEFTTIANSVRVIGGSVAEGSKVRPGTEISFKVQKFNFRGEPTELDKEKVKWKQSGKVEAEGIGDVFKKTYFQEGNYVVEAYVSKPNAYWGSTNQEDDWRFTVNHKYPTEIQGPLKAKLGLNTAFTMSTIFPLTHEERLSIAWEVEGPRQVALKGGEILRFPFLETGSYAIKASLNGKSKEIRVRCVECAIDKAWWTDKDGNYLAEGNDAEDRSTLGYAGWGQEVCIALKHMGLEGEKMTLEVWDKDLVSDDLLLTKEITIPNSRTPGFVITLDEDMKEKAGCNIPGQTGLLYFTLKPLNSQLKVQKAGMAFPQNQGEYLKVDSKPRIRAYFADNNDTKRFMTASPTTPVYAQLKTTGYQDQELKVEVMESIKWGSDTVLLSAGTTKPDRQGMISLPLDFNKVTFKSESETKQLYLRISPSKEGTEELHIANGTIFLTLYKLIPYEPVAKGTTKALVVVDVSEGKKAKTKQIIFPLLVKSENDLHKKWGKDCYWAGPVASNQATFNSNRENKRKHAARDLYTKPFTDVVSICEGVVLEITDFYCYTHQVTVKHKTEDGREFIIRYGELDKESITVKLGTALTQGQIIGKTGKLLKYNEEKDVYYSLMVKNSVVVYMLHFEYYTGAMGMNISKPLTERSRLPFQRRSDMEDPILILQEGYRTTFGDNTGKSDDERVAVSSLKTSKLGIDFIKAWEDFKSLPYNDSDDYCTIGYGHLIAMNKCENITIPKEFKSGIDKEKATALFNQKLVTFENAIKREITVDLHQYEFDALVSLVFNTGEFFLSTGGKKGGDTKIKTLINSKDYSGGAVEFLDVTNNNTSGLVKRRKAENNMFLNNVYDSTH